MSVRLSKPLFLGVVITLFVVPCIACVGRYGDDHTEANGKTCPLYIASPVSGKVTDASGAKITPDRVVVSVNGMQGECMIISDFPDASYSCSEAGLGTYDVTVTVQGHSLTQSVSITQLTADGCHVNEHKTLNFMFDFSLQDGGPVDDG